MLKINYPQTAAERNTMRKAYLDVFPEIEEMQKAFDEVLHTLELNPGKRFTVRYILTASIKELKAVSSEIMERCSENNIARLKNIFNYDKQTKGKKYQPDIAEFFMKANYLNMSTCYYCNIDHINSFRLIGDFKDWKQLVKKGSVKDLEKVKGITQRIAERILEKRDQVNKSEDLDFLTIPVRENLERLEPKGRSNHFTLDHVLDKASHPVAALSLFNFVPCCYNCNSKFKRSKPLVDRNTRISPTSKDFSFGESVRFRIIFRNQDAKSFEDINDITDFELNFDIRNDHEDYDKYLDVFKLHTRYIFHKKEALNLILKRKRYSDSQIAEIAALTRRTEQEIKKDLFGAELFDDNPDAKPLSKLKRDIALDIGIREIKY